MTITEAYHKGYNDGLYDGYNTSSIERGLTKEEYDPPEEQDTCGDAVIDDIKTEIETEMQDCTAQWHDAWWNGKKDGLKDALEIIDRHISEKNTKQKENKSPCYDCKHFEKSGWLHCKIHEDCWGDCRCNDYQE